MDESDETLQHGKKDFRMTVVSILVEDKPASSPAMGVLARATYRKTFPKITIPIILLILFFCIAGNLYAKQIEQRELVIFPLPHEIYSQITISNETYGTPIKLTIPALNTVADVQSVGTTPEGEMEVPREIADVGWYEFGPAPGEKGNSVIAGHLSGEQGENGVFTDLSKLKEGDKIYVDDNKGNSIIFMVKESRTYDPGHADDVFSQSDGVAHLNLITCDGTWDGHKKSYTKRLVVFADIVK